VDKYYPAWALEPDHPLVLASQATRQAVGLPEADPGKWDFSTNGTYWTGKAGIPSIGFGPGEEEVAHTVMDRNSLAEVVKATEFYALFPALVAQAD
jgi:acetylornithine deacetylase/succinyl-diaminopimelate desuccinylase-like protein